jgi:hypothetical protein
MSLWWIPAGIAAWFLISVVVALCMGPVLAHCSQARETPGQQWARASGARKPTWKNRQVSPGSRARARLLQSDNRMLLCEIGRGYRGGNRGEET